MADSTLENDIYILALQNAVKNKAVPRAGAVLGSVMGAHPELRSQAKEINALLPAILAKVEALSAEEREIGGLGIFITKKTMNSVTYAYENGENILTMIKNI